MFKSWVQLSLHFSHLHWGEKYKYQFLFGIHVLLYHMCVCVALQDVASALCFFPFRYAQQWLFYYYWSLFPRISPPEIRSFVRKIATTFRGGGFCAFGGEAFLVPPGCMSRFLGSHLQPKEHFCMHMNNAVQCPSHIPPSLSAPRSKTHTTSLPTNVHVSNFPTFISILIYYFWSIFYFFFLPWRPKERKKMFKKIFNIWKYIYVYDQKKSFFFYGKAQKQVF